jgi:hypothetical protein
MSSLLYKRHSIIYGAALNAFTGKYAVLALALTIVLAVGWMRTYWTA